MSKNRIKIFRGKFYSNYRTGGGHPSLVFSKNKKKNLYSCVVFDTTDGKHRKPLIHPISDKVDKSFVQNRPLICQKNDFGNHELKNLKINKEDKPRVEWVKRNNPRYTSKTKKEK